MGKLIAYNFITLNGYYKGPGDDISWHRHGQEEGEFAAANLESDSILVFGRKTYEQMAGYWPTKDAIKNMTEVANGMNRAEKIVFSRTLKKAGWNNTRLISDHIADEMKKLKKKTKDMVILGSGSIIAQFAELGLIDEYQFMIDPVALGKGTPIFKDIRNKLDLELLDTRVFKSGVILAIYQPQKN